MISLHAAYIVMTLCSIFRLCICKILLKAGEDNGRRRWKTGLALIHQNIVKPLLGVGRVTSLDMIMMMSLLNHSNACPFKDMRKRLWRGCTKVKQSKCCFFVCMSVTMDDKTNVDQC